MGVRSALQYGARARVDVKQDRRVVCIGTLAPGPENARERLDAA